MFKIPIIKLNRQWKSMITKMIYNDIIYRFQILNLNSHEENISKWGKVLNQMKKLNQMGKGPEKSLKNLKCISYIFYFINLYISYPYFYGLDCFHE